MTTLGPYFGTALLLFSTLAYSDHAPQPASTLSFRFDEHAYSERDVRDYIANGLLTDGDRAGIYLRALREMLWIRILHAEAQTLGLETDADAEAISKERSLGRSVIEELLARRKVSGKSRYGPTKGLEELKRIAKEAESNLNDFLDTHPDATVHEFGEFYARFPESAELFQPATVTRTTVRLGFRPWATTLKTATDAVARHRGEDFLRAFLKSANEKFRSQVWKGIHDDLGRAQETSKRYPKERLEQWAREEEAATKATEPGSADYERHFRQSRIFALAALLGAHTDWNTKDLLAQIMDVLTHLSTSLASLTPERVLEQSVEGLGSWVTAELERTGRHAERLGDLDRLRATADLFDLLKSIATVIARRLEHDWIERAAIELDLRFKAARPQQDTTSADAAQMALTSAWNDTLAFGREYLSMIWLGDQKSNLRLDASTWARSSTRQAYLASTDPLFRGVPFLGPNSRTETILYNRRPADNDTSLELLFFSDKTDPLPVLIGPTYRNLVEEKILDRILEYRGLETGDDGAPSIKDELLKKYEHRLEIYDLDHKPLPAAVLREFSLFGFRDEL